MLNRRALLKGMLATPLAYVIAGHKTARAQPPFTVDYGVASGDPRPDRVVLWTRVPEIAQPVGGDPVGVQYQVATSRFFAPGSIVRQGEVAADATADYTVKVLADGLAPATRYFYRFTTTTSYRSVVGRIKTAPAPDAQPDAIRFAYVSCQRFTDGFYTVFARLALEDVDFCVHLGDTIYEGGSPSGESNPIREDRIGQAIRWRPTAKSINYISLTRSIEKYGGASPGWLCGMIMSCLGIMPAASWPWRIHSASGKRMPRSWNTPPWSRVCRSAPRGRPPSSSIASSHLGRCSMSSRWMSVNTAMAMSA